MELKKIKELVKIMEGNNIDTLELTEGDVKISLKKGNSGINMNSNLAPSIPNIKSEIKLVENTVPDVKPEATSEIKSPMVGVFYKAPSPDAEPFVKVGSRVKKGDVLCIIEAMKLMNEIYAERDGVISEVCLNDGDVAEYSQILFRMN